ncbi:hypothetical protein [Streptomyces clavifer]|uniref:hypothetical protein n=1 Tax=Streptomyces clavifer TaxID=68188 RepID=UPI003821B45F
MVAALSVAEPRAIAIQIRRSAEVLGYDPENMTQAQRDEVEKATQETVARVGRPTTPKPTVVASITTWTRQGRHWMTEQDTKERTRRPPGKAVAIALCAAFLLVLHAIGGFFLLNALLVESEGPWDRTVTDTARAMALFALVTELLAAAVTGAFVALVRLRRWWFAIPAVLLLAAIARMVFPPVP